MCPAGGVSNCLLTYSGTLREKISLQFSLQVNTHLKYFSTIILSKLLYCILSVVPSLVTVVKSGVLSPCLYLSWLLAKHAAAVTLHVSF